MHAPYGVLVGFLIGLFFVSGNPQAQEAAPAFYGLFTFLPFMASLILDSKKFKIADALIFGMFALSGFIVGSL